MLDRRNFLAAAAAAALPTAALAQAGKSRAIDVHHHFAPPSFIADTKLRPHPNPVYFGWSQEKSLEDMDRAGVAMAVLSVNNVWAGDDARAIKLARECNDYAAKMAQDHKGRYGRFACVPLPNVDAALKELAYGLDVLHCDGVSMMTSYGDKWLGDPAFYPVFEELNRRKAVVYTHPTTANCCGELLPNIADAIIEFGTDTTRAIASLAFYGTMKKCPGIRFIFSHAGGTMPYLVWRFEAQSRQKATADGVPADGVFPALRRQYYDCAQAATPITMQALTKLVPVSQVLFGTDFPFTTAKAHLDGLATCGFSAHDLRAIWRGNALRLMPGLKTA
jgi:predicted TIM-barrel fold metal-dependent hydrolase